MEEARSAQVHVNHAWSLLVCVPWWSSVLCKACNYQQVDSGSAKGQNSVPVQYTGAIHRCNTLME